MRVGVEPLEMGPIGEEMGRYSFRVGRTVLGSGPGEGVIGGRMGR